MHAESSQISLLKMSNSEMFLVEDDDEEKGMQSDILKQPVLEFRKEYSQATATSCSSTNNIPDDHEDKKGGENEVKSSKESEKTEISLGEFKATDDDDDDGFKTPTSLDHKIPVMKQCPPAPRKPKPLPSNKRKASTPSSVRNLQPDLSQEVESLFPGPPLADLHRKVKKARTQ